MSPRQVTVSWFILALASLVGELSSVDAQPPFGGPGGFGRPAAKPGVSVKEPKATPGYTLVAALNSTKAYLIDLDGRIVKTWDTGFTPGASTYLLDDGHLLRTGNLGPGKNKINGAAVGGKVLEFDWDGKVVWDYTYVTDNSQPHHDIRRLPNGNALIIVWDKKSPTDAIAAGRRPDQATKPVLSDAILEVKPTGKTTGEVVWEWHAWDHLIQDRDKTKANFGNVGAHPELIDVNFGSGELAKMMANPADLKKLRDLGYVGGPSKSDDAKDKGKGKDDSPAGPGGPPRGPGMPGVPGMEADWLHTNSIDYNADLDQILLSIHEFNEIWIIDHSTSSAEAKGRAGGKYGKGGDLIYRWGNPRAYRSGTNADQRLYQQHNAHWIPKGLPGEGHIMIFNNGAGRNGGTNYSTVDEIVPPLLADGKYTRKPGLPYGPDKPTWSYAAEKKTDFFALLISGAHRLPNGNTLICSGPDATVFEITPEKKTVWKFVNPGGNMLDFLGMMSAMPRPGDVLAPFVRDQLKLTPDQRKQVDELQKDLNAKLDKILTEDQRKQFQGLRNSPGGGGMPMGPPGGFARGGGPGGPPGAGGGMGGPPGLFRAYRYPIDHPAFAGRTLKPGKKIEDETAVK